jgi:IS6 family transposase
LQASAKLLPWAVCTSIWRSFSTTCSAPVYRAVDKHGNPVDFLLTANRDLDAAKRFLRKMLADQPLLAPDRIGTDGASTYPAAIVAARSGGLLARPAIHYVTKHLQQGIESDHFRVKKNMPRIGGFRSFHTA